MDRDPGDGVVADADVNQLIELEVEEPGGPEALQMLRAPAARGRLPVPCNVGAPSPTIVLFSCSIAMQQLPLDYERPPVKEPGQASPLWLILRVILATPIAGWGILLVVQGMGGVFAGRMRNVPFVLLGVLLIAAAVVIIRPPMNRPRM